MNIYIQNFIVQAEPAVDKNGRTGFDVYYPDGRTQWIPQGDFEIHHRVLDVRERMIMDMNTQELAILSISDKDYPDLEDPDS